MDMLSSILPLHLLALSLLVAFGAGVIKGIVGFAMPMILLSGLSTFLPPDLALAGLLLPTLITNGMQALRHGLPAVWKAIRAFRTFLIFGGILLFASAQLVPLISTSLLLLIVGIAVTGFAIWQLSGKAPVPGSWRRSFRADLAMGGFAGMTGGISGIWGPPTVAYLTAIGTQKREQMLVQGVIYGLGAVLLVIAHIKSGVLNSETIPLSLALLPPAVLGMAFGARISDSFDQATFRRATLIVLCIGGLNLLRRGLMG